MLEHKRLDGFSHRTISKQSPRQLAGFTLLEVVVALLILVICITVVMRILAGSTRVAMMGEEYFTALQIAESKMAALKTLQLQGEFIDTGFSSERFEWVVEAKYYEGDTDEIVLPVEILNDPLAAHRLYQFDVRVYWGARGQDGRGTREFRLSSLGLKARDVLE